MIESSNFPSQNIPYSKKNKKWRKQCVDWAKGRTFFTSEIVRNTIIHKKINYDLLLGKLSMKDLESIINPDNVDAGYIPSKIQHYPIMNSKLNVLRGEEYKRPFDFKVIITNPNAVSEIEENKKNEVYGKLQELITNTELSDDQFNQELEKLGEFYKYDWQDLMEIRSNEYLNHYYKEYNMPMMFNEGFMDAATVGEEIYLCDIVSGEPIVERINPLKIRTFKSGFSNRIEDADIIILEDYWSPAKIVDTYYEQLSSKDIEYLEGVTGKTTAGAINSMGELDERYGFMDKNLIGDFITSQGDFFFSPYNYESMNNSLLPYDVYGNVRVIRMYWKSRRRIKKVKSYNIETGEEEYDFFPESHVINKDLGEEEEIFFVNEAWEGTLIGEDIYVNMRPRPIQYNRLSNPSRCHFGIIGSIYNMNQNKPFSLVDMMKSYNYYYDVIHDRLNKSIANHWGDILELDLAQVPTDWEIDKWLYFAKVNKIAVKDSFKEGNIGTATGKLAGGFANNSRGILSSNVGNYIQQLMNLLEYIKSEMAEVVGITRQREGQISNRETVGGVERATLQSSHITEWIFTTHEDLKKRVLECFLETAKIAYKGTNKKFQHILSDNSIKISDIDGDAFADADYGLVIDISNGSQELRQKIDVLAQAALQNQTLNFSTIMKLYNSCSLAEKQRMIEKNEAELQERQQQAQQQQIEAQQMQLQQQAQIEEAKMVLQDTLNQRDNDTKLIIAGMSNNEDGISENATPELLEKMREFDEKIKLDKEKLEFEKAKADKEFKLRKYQQSKNK